MEHEVKNESIGETREDEREKWVYDSSLDRKGRVPLRASTGVWKASFFIIAIEFSERMSYFGILTNLISYLTTVMHQDLETAAKNVNDWSGVTTLMPLVGGFLADAYTGRFPMILISALIYLMGFGLLSMSQLIPSLKACNVTTCNNPRQIHKVVFFLAMYILSLGSGGFKPCLESFGADQFDDDHEGERKKKMSFFNLWSFALSCGLFFGVTVIAYVQDDVSWGVASLILSVTMAIAIALFFSGKMFYRYRMPVGSPLTPMLQVLVAAIRKRKLSYPSCPDVLYEVSKSQKSKRRLLGHTNNLRFLDKAAIIEGNENLTTEKQQNPWRLAAVTNVEETKLIINMIPIWLTSLAFSLCEAQTTTFFVKQSATMNRKMGHNFQFPAASIQALSAIAQIISVIFIEKILVPVLRRATGNERGIKILKRIGIGLLLSTLSMIIAALVERKRLRVVEREIISGKRTGTLSMSAFWLAPQILVLGFADGFTLVGLQEYFYDQVPDSMRSLGIAFYLSVIGLGHLLSSVVITVVDHITRKAGASWFGKDLNHKSRLDNFYWLLAVVNGLNLCVFVVLAKRYKYKKVQRNEVMAECCADDGTDTMA